MDLAELVLLADRVGIVAFAIAGVAVGVRRRMDLFGLLAIGMLAAIGGGAVNRSQALRRPRPAKPMKATLVASKPVAARFVPQFG